MDVICPWMLVSKQETTRFFTRLFPFRSPTCNGISGRVGARGHSSDLVMVTQQLSLTLMPVRVL